MQIGCSIGESVKESVKKGGGHKKVIDNHLIEAIALAHDIGHTPYGHVGERTLCDFFKEGINGGELLPSKKLKHSFQSFKICCFLEKQYTPDLYGLNLTVATLDGILKHSKIPENEMNFYKGCFESYIESFWEEAVKNEAVKNDVLEEMKNCFEFISPVTLEGVTVSISDEIAQMCHDLEDLRRLSDFNTVRPFYEAVIEEIKEVESCMPKRPNAKKIYEDFKRLLTPSDTKEFEVIKIERLYIKLMLSLCIQIVSELLVALHNMEEDERLEYLKNNYLGSFEDILKARPTLIKGDRVEVLKILRNIFKKYERVMLEIPAIAKWDMKGKELCEELSDKLLKTIFDEQEEKLKLNIFKRDMRKHLEKSYKAGVVFCKRFGFNNTKVAPKFVIWDYLASMTDNYIINEYESMTFKKVELR